MSGLTRSLYKGNRKRAPNPWQKAKKARKGKEKAWMKKSVRLERYVVRRQAYKCSRCGLLTESICLVCHTYVKVESLRGVKGTHLSGQGAGTRGCMGPAGPVT